MEKDEDMTMTADSFMLFLLYLASFLLFAPLTIWFTVGIASDVYRDIIDEFRRRQRHH